MPPHIYIYDQSGNPVVDPMEAAKYATGLNWSSVAPKGHASASFQVHQDIAAQWRVKPSYELIIKDGSNIRWQGRLRAPKRKLSGGRETITLEADGWYAALAERYMRRRWADNDAVSRLVFPDYTTATGNQNQLLYTKHEGFILFRAGYGDIGRTVNTGIALRYTMPDSTLINNFSCAIDIVTGEGLRFYVINVDQAATEDLGGAHGSYLLCENGTPDDMTPAFTLAQGDTERIDFRIYYDQTDTYDNNDWLKFRDLIIYAVMDSFASPNFYADEIIQDMLEIGAADVISNNYTGLDSPGLAIIPFMTLNDEDESLDSIATRLCQFGDSSNNTWNFYVWDETGASDGLPRAYLTQRSTSDHEYRVRLADMTDFESEPDLSTIGNFVRVKYQDAEGYTKYLTGDTNATLKDQDSIDTYYRRELRVDAGQCDAATALDLGERWLANSKDPKDRGQFTIKGRIRNKYNIWVPATQMRAGERVYVEDWNGGETWFLREARIDGDNYEATCIRDLPPDSLQVELARQKAGLI